MRFILALSLLGVLATTESRTVKPFAAKDGRIIGGGKTKDGSAPYHVSIQNTFGEHVCGGSIIDKEWILTAAHCMDWPIKYLKVVTGTVNWTKPDGEYTISEARVHCLYNQPYSSNDIALLKLTKRIVYNKGTQPIKLATANTLQDGDPLVLTGWGSVKLWGRYPEVMHKVNLKYLSHDKCKSKIKKSSKLHAGHLCTFTRKGEGSCQGDSGSPLVDANQVQVGIVNWGEPCALGYPDVYASVAYYHDWIVSNIRGSSNICKPKSS